jgi:DNA polymerase-3 subunit alpha
MKGYLNLIQIVSQSDSGENGRSPEIDRDSLTCYSEGLIGLSGSIEGEIPQLILAGRIGEARERAEQYQSIFGQGSFFLEVQIHGLTEEETIARELCRISKESGIPLAAANSCRYLRREDAEALDLYSCIVKREKLNDPGRKRHSGSEYFIKSSDDMDTLFREYPEALTHSAQIAGMCDFKLELPEMMNPQFNLNTHTESTASLRKLAVEGLKKRYGEITSDLEEKLADELEVFRKREFEPHLLILHDLTRFARSQNILTSPRGSLPGSLTAYVLGITGIDPVRHGLLYERFLNDHSGALPEISLDVSPAGRVLLVQYLSEKYGSGRVSPIISFSKMPGRTVFREAGKVMGLPDRQIDWIAKLLPGLTARESIQSALAGNPELQKILHQGTEEEQKLLRIAAQLENLIRTIQINPVTIVISGRPVMDLLPIQTVIDDDGNIQSVIQFESKYLHDYGFFELSLCAMIEMGRMEETLRLLKEQGILIEPDRIPLNDPEVFKLFTRKNAQVPFPFNSPGMKKHLLKLKPSCLEDLMAMDALYRPELMDWLDSYINRKHGVEKVTDDHPLLEGVLKETYGLLIYQEDLMQTARIIAGYTLKDADRLRRAFGRKKPEEIELHRRFFIEGDLNPPAPFSPVAGAVHQGLDAETAGHIFQWLSKLSPGTVMKSHTAASVRLSYQMAWLQTHYPDEWRKAGEICSHG